MKTAVSNLLSFNRRRSAPATMYDLIDQCHEWNNSTATNLVQPMDNYTDGFWKVFMLNDKTGTNVSCCDRNSYFDRHMKSDGDSPPTCQCMKHSKTARRRRFKSQSGYYLAIMPNGQIMGNKDSNSPYSKYNFPSFFCYLFLLIV